MDLRINLFYKKVPLKYIYILYIATVTMILVSAYISLNFIYPEAAADLPIMFSSWASAYRCLFHIAKTLSVVTVIVTPIASYHSSSWEVFSSFTAISAFFSLIACVITGLFLLQFFLHKAYDQMLTNMINLKIWDALMVLFIFVVKFLILLITVWNSWLWKRIYDLSREPEKAAILIERMRRREESKSRLERKLEQMKKKKEEQEKAKANEEKAKQHEEKAEEGSGNEEVRERKIKKD